MNDAFDFVLIVDDGEISKAGFIELIKNERAKDFLVMNENHFGFVNHEFGDSAIIETHDGGNTVAILAI